MKTNYKAIIFDFDGVLNDTEEIKFDVWQKIAKKHGKKINKEFYIRNCCGRSGKKIAGDLVRKYGIPMKVDRLPKLMHKASIPLLKKHMKPIKNNIQFLKKSNKIFKGNVGIASSQEIGMLRYSLKKLKIFRYIREIVSGYKMKNTKPAPDLYLKICKKLKIKPKECIVVEDSEAGVKSAYNAGIGRIIAIPREFTRYQDFSKANIVIRKNSLKIKMLL
ncbi:hypothetical protein CMO83_05470 [Candidatus Woesearchaeota archaeon]|jgi:HAD superfamily hydrolase (TIGR01509 family)|nr:hypothetical protein [Candidatus Woesearchaeota archaeon]|tara:strand:+ start:2602 stop:3258 length:657 start_codon:yes stop_codon:yes gene_type:complete